MDTPNPLVPTAEAATDDSKVQEPREIRGIPAHTVLMAQIVCALLVLLPILGYNIWAEGKAALAMERQLLISITNALASHQLTLTSSTKSLLLSMSRAPVMHCNEAESIHNYLQQVGRDLPNYDAFIVFTPTGEVLAGLRNGKPLKVSPEVIRNRLYYKEALQRNAFSVNSALVLDDGTTILPMTMPIYRPDEDRPVAFLLSGVSLSRQALIMQNMTAGNDTTILLFDSRFQPLFSSSGTSSNSKASATLFVQDIPNFFRENAFHFVEESHTARQTFGLQADNGVVFAGAVAAMSLSAKKDPYLYIAVLTQQPSWQEFVTQRYMWLIASMLVVGLLGLYVSARVGKFYFADGLERMSTIAELTRKGDLTLRCGKISGCREIQVTSGAFDLMLAVVERNTAELYQLSLMDPLTGLWNRRHFAEAAKQELEFAIRNKYPVTVVMADIDHFKRVNDTYGHSIGDVVLQQFSKTLRGHIRGSDLLARYGGEEFILLLPNTDAAGASILLEKLRARTEALVVTIPDGREVRFTSSFGGATASALTAASETVLTGLQSKADAALYMAKTAGRNQVVIMDALLTGESSLSEAPFDF